MAKEVRQQKAPKPAESDKVVKRGGSVVSAGFKRTFTASERAEIKDKRREMHERLYAAG